MQPIIAHLDMNSYFASVEQQDNLQWRGKPLGVCEHLGGIIIAASIEAKRWGIKTGTPVWEARKLYPKIILTKTHPDRYRFYIKKVLKVVGDYTGFVEQTSIDEMFLDLSKACNVRFKISDLPAGNAGLRLKNGEKWELIDPFTEAEKIAKEIKCRMKKQVADWLTCSVGISDNKLVAKIASNLKKPDGLNIVRPQDKHLLYSKLKLTDIPGIGRRQEKNLNRLGIKTLLDLKNYPLSLLVTRFGIHGYHLYNMGQLKGSWKPDVEKDDVIKSIGHMYTLPREFREKKFFVPVLYKLCEMVARRMRKQGLMGNILHFYVSDKNYQGFGESGRLGFFVYDGREIFLQCIGALDKLNLPPGEFKLIGVTVAGLRPYIRQLSLFGHEEKTKRLTEALDKINSKYGDFTVCRVPILAAKEAFNDSIGFGRIKELN